ncbi:MAG: NTP transferase domain-containing protein [Bacteroidia bacterium]|nr:NTP transferase domain-containing protein [Bacteroidia bacterium]
MPLNKDSQNDNKLGKTGRISEDKILNRTASQSEKLRSAEKVLITLVAGKGTRFGTEPKCIQPVHGLPLARHSIDAFKRISNSPVISIVGYRHEDVISALGQDNTYILTDNPAGGTALAAFEREGNKE